MAAFNSYQDSISVTLDDFFENLNLSNQPLNHQEVLEGVNAEDLEEMLTNGRVFYAQAESSGLQNDSNLQPSPHSSIPKPSCVLGALCQDSSCPDEHPDSE